MVIKIPVKSNKIPPIFSIKFIFFFKFLEIKINFWNKYPDKIKGMANPREYEDNNKIPLAITSLVDAKAKIDPRIGPIHGVQPNAKAIPNTIGLKIFLLLLA